ncbi:MAG: hypothetical protein TIS_04242 [Tissierella sp.]
MSFEKKKKVSPKYQDERCTEATQFIATNQDGIEDLVFIPYLNEWAFNHDERNRSRKGCYILLDYVKSHSIHCVYNVYFLSLWKILKIMATIALQKKRKNIDLPIDTLQKLSIMAASQGKSVKAFIENLLVSKADTLKIEVSSPSPSGDPYFADPSNLAEVEERVKAHKEGKVKATVVLRSVDDITNFINSL